MAIKAITLRLDEDVLDYLDHERAKYGVSRPAMVSFMIQTYKTQQDALNATGVLSDVVNKLDELNNKLDSKA